MRALLAFFTVLPVRDATLTDAARYVYLLPLVGVVVGAPAALLVLLAGAFPAGVVAVLALGVALLAAGFHHTDGVLDVGDALMVRGSRERRRAVLKDSRVGVGGIGGLFLIYGPALAALAALVAASPFLAALAVLGGEVCARSAMLLMLAYGEPAEPSSSSVPFVEALKGPRRAGGIALALVAPVPFLASSGAGLIFGPIVAPMAAMLGLIVSRRAFGGTSGDVTGATGELARTAFLVLLSATA